MITVAAGSLYMIVAAVSLMILTGSLTMTATSLPTPLLYGSVLVGYLITMFTKTLSVHMSYEADLREVYGDDVFGAVVPLAKDFKEAVAARLPVAAYKPRSASARAVKEVADELLDLDNAGAGTTATATTARGPARPVTACQRLRPHDRRGLMLVVWR